MHRKLNDGACGELFCLEHDVQPNGQLLSDSMIGGDDALNLPYTEFRDGKPVPFCKIVDLERTAVDFADDMQVAK